MPAPMARTLSRLRRLSCSLRSSRFASICWTRRLASRAFRELAAKSPPGVGLKPRRRQGAVECSAVKLPAVRPYPAALEVAGAESIN
ncbi:hypothetical protein D9M70_635400 [compost metagenome]